MEDNRLFEEHPEQYSLCLRVRQQLPDYVEGILDAMAAEVIRAHISVCYLCAREYEELQETVRLIESLPFVEPLRDFSPAILAALRPQSGYSFQAPVVEMETEALARPSMPRATTGRKRQFLFRISDFGFRIDPPSLVGRGAFRIGKPNGHGLTEVRPADLGAFGSLRERIMTAFALVAALIALVLHPSGQAAIESQRMAGHWFERASEAVGSVPILGSLAAAVSGLFAGASDAVGKFAEVFGRAPVPIIVLDAALLAVGAAFYGVRRSKSMKASNHA